MDTGLDPSLTQTWCTFSVPEPGHESILQCTGYGQKSYSQSPTSMRLVFVKPIPNPIQ